MRNNAINNIANDIIKEMRTPKAQQFLEKRRKVAKVLEKLTLEDIKLLDDMYTELSKESMGNTWDKIDTALYKILRDLHISDQRIKKAYKMLVDEIGGVNNVNISIQEQER